MNVVSLTDHDRDLLGEELERLPSPYVDIETFLLDVWPLFARLPRPVLTATRALRNDPAAPGALLVQNLPVDPELPPTPNTAGADGERRTFVTEGCGLGIAQLLGEAVGYRDERDGAVIQWLCPIESEARATSSSSWDIDLEFHTDLNYDSANPEAPFTVINPDFVVLACARPDPEGQASTKYVEATRLCEHLADEHVATLRQPVFEFAAPYSFTGRAGSERLWSRPSPVLTGPPAWPEIGVDMACGARGCTPEATAALDALRQVAHMPGVADSVRLRPGDVLVFDNRKGAHGRSVFAAHFDGRDRWVERVYVRRSLWECRRDGHVNYRVV
jgi:L-asparagine oxygenase